MVRLLGRLDREPVHDLHRTRQDPGGDDARDRVARLVDGRERGELRDDDLRLTHHTERDLDRDAERALRPDEDAEEIGPVLGVDRLAAELEQLAVRQHDLRAGHVVDGEAVLETVRAARVLGEVPADRAHLLTGRVGRVEVAGGRDGARHLEVRHAGLDDDALAPEVDLDDPVHPGDRDDDPVGDRKRSTGEPGAGAAGDEGNPIAGTQPQHGPNLVGRARQHHARRLRAPAREPVAVVRREPLGLRDHVHVAECPAQILDEAGRKRHAGDPTGRPPPHRDVGDR